MTTSTLASPASPEKPSTTIHAMRKKKGKKGLLLTLLFLVITGIGVWYFFFRPEPAAVPFIRFAIVDKGDITKSVTATGTLQATTTVQVGSQVSGTIRALHADFNTRVTKGQLVAELDPTFYEASVKAAEANFARASADQRISQLNADRSKELFDKNLVSRAEYDQATTTALDSKSTVQQMQAALDQAKVNLSYTKIHAPISGVVTQRSVDVGQTVAASLNAPVLFIIAQDLTEMEVQANVDEADIGQVKQGQSVTFTVDAFSGEKFHGVVKLVRLNPIIQQNVVTYTVVISAQNKEEKLFPGMTATVTITNSAVQDVIRIPAAAIRFTPPLPEGTMSPSQALRPQGNAVQGGGGNWKDRVPGGNRSNGGTIYRRIASAANPGEMPKLEAIKVQLGISDGMNAEVLSSDKPLTPGDSIGVGSILPSKPGAVPAPSSNPFGAPTGSPRRGP